MSDESPYRTPDDVAAPREPAPPDRFLLWIVLTPLVVLLSAVGLGLLQTFLGFSWLVLVVVAVGWSFLPLLGDISLLGLLPPGLLLFVGAIVSWWRRPRPGTALA